MAVQDQFHFVLCLIRFNVPRSHCSRPDMTRAPAVSAGEGKAGQNPRISAPAIIGCRISTIRDEQSFVETAFYGCIEREKDRYAATLRQTPCLPPRVQLRPCY